MQLQPSAACRFTVHLCLSPQPLGGVRPLHQKSICLTHLTSGPYVVQSWSRNTLELSGNENCVLHRVSLLLFFITLGLGLSDTKVYEP